MTDDHEKRLAEIEAELDRREKRAEEVLKQFATVVTRQNFALGGLIVIAFLLLLFGEMLFQQMVFRAVTKTPDAYMLRPNTTMGP